MSTALESGQPPLAIRDLQHEVEDYLERLVFSREPSTSRLCEAMRYSLMAGGKRIRPVIALATAEVLGHVPASVLPLAAAFEMIHTHSLMHVDLPAMHERHVRRGKPAAHVAFGEDVALLAGDALFAEAIALVLRKQEGDGARVVAAVAELTHAVGVAGLVGGQYVNVTTAREVGAGELRHLHELKTGRLLAAAVGTVVTIVGASGTAATALRRFAAQLGILFQIVDDVVDAVDGKARRAPTSVSVFGLEHACELARESHALALAALAEVPGDTSALEQIANYGLTRSGRGCLSPRR